MIQLEFQQKLSGRLLPRERILWAGRPRQGFMFQEGDAFTLPFALLWTLGGVGLPLTSGRITWSLNSLFFLPFFVGGFYMLIGRYLHDAWGRNRTFYAVTDRRVLIWREGPRASFKALDRDGLAQMELKEQGGRGTILFGPGEAFYQVRSTSQSLGVARAQFRGIPDARAVFDLLQRTKPRTMEPASPDAPAGALSDRG